MVAEEMHTLAWEERVEKRDGEIRCGEREGMHMHMCWAYGGHCAIMYCARTGCMSSGVMQSLIF